ncbi:MAG: hypothetical protein JXR64_06855, partial [Spirochaetales bacterium]|nr:hypothetical protein [Spirochaetales bacterium]
ITSGFLNDNYTGSTENGERGRYIGADDFLTFSLFVKSKSDNLGIAQYYQVVTSRKFHYRYDLITTNITYEKSINDFIFIPSIELLYKSSLGGEYIQNLIHDFKDLPLLVEDYTSSELGAGFGGTGYIDLGISRAIMSIYLPTSIKPASGLLCGELYLKNNFIGLNLVGGYKQYFSKVDEYSDFVRSGFLFGGQTMLNIMGHFTINAGAFFFPVKNIENDPSYYNKNHDYSPQFWVSLGLNGMDFRILDIVNI